MLIVRNNFAWLGRSLSGQQLRNLGFCLLCLAWGPALRADVMLSWNEVLCDVLLADRTIQNPGMASRSMAMTNIAMYDAINIVTGEYRPVYADLTATEPASKEAAAVQAGYRVLAELYPGQRSLLDARRTQILDSLPPGAATTNGLQLGDQVGTMVVQARSDDGFDRMRSYQTQDRPGSWQPDPLNPDQMAWGPGWGSVRPFVLPSSRTFMPPAMPDITSAAYTEAFDEVKRLGAVDSATRTAEQTETGLFWAYDRVGMGTPMRLFNDIMRTVAAGQGNSLEENARMFAMASTAVADAGITAWDAKFLYDFWRPVTGIRAADTDGNPATQADPTWTPLGSPGGVLEDGTFINDFTPPFPTYISGHATFAGALFQSFSNFYGTDEISFQVSSDEVPGVTRTYERFSDAAIENGRSRVYLGIHWNFDDFVGRDTGIEIADYIAEAAFQAVPEPTSAPVAVWTVLGMVVARLRRRGRHRMGGT